MSKYPPNESKAHGSPVRRGPTFVLSREKFDEIPGCRARYIVLYILIFLWWIAPKAVYLVTKENPPFEFATIYYVVLVGLYAPFYFYFSKAMRTLGYPLYWILPTLLVVFLPIPGILAMGYMDRKIADAWDKADGEHERYRQRIVEEERSETE